MMTKLSGLSRAAINLCRRSVRAATISLPLLSLGLFVSVFVSVSPAFSRSAQVVGASW